MGKIIKILLIVMAAPFILYSGMVVSYVISSGNADSYAEQVCIRSHLINGATQEFAEEQCL